MNGSQRIETWFETGALVHPTAEGHSFADLVRAFRLLGHAGADPGSGSAGAQAVANLISGKQVNLFILLDGLGADLLQRLPPGSFMRDHCAATLRAVFPATTASALATLATGLWPAEHCVPGWWTRLPDAALSAVTLLFTERDSNASLSRFRIAPERLFPSPSFWPSMGLATRAVLPSEIANSVFSGYLTGGAVRTGYKNLSSAFSTASRLASSADRPTLVYLYVPYLDALIHNTGTGDPRVTEMLLDIDRRLAELARSLCGRVRLIVTGDHGLVDVPHDRIFVLGAEDPLALMLECQPTGEPSSPVFHLRAGSEPDFARGFEERLGEHFALISPGQAESLRLYGPGPLAPAMRERLGTFIGIAAEPAKLYVQPVGGSAHHKASHGGLRPSEMLIPLIVS